MAGGSQKAIIAAFFANLGVAIAKFVGFAITGSASMLAEGVHSVADTSNQGLLLLGGQRARRAATREHPFGYGRERYFWSFIVALVIFTLGGLFALYEGEEKLRHPHELTSPAVAIVILALAIVFEALSLRTAIVESQKVKGTASWWAFIRRSKSPELPVVLLEDVGALLGLVFALVGVVMAELTGAARWDAAGSLAIGVLLVAIAVTLMIEMKSLIIGESASAATEREIRQVIERNDGIRGIIHMRTQHIGPEELLVGVKVELDADLDVPGVAHAVNEVEAALRDAVPDARVIYIEPDVSRSPSAPAG